MKGHNRASGPMWSINKAKCVVKLLSTSTSVYLCYSDLGPLCLFLSPIEHTTQLPVSAGGDSTPSYPLPPAHTFIIDTHDIRQKSLKNQQFQLCRCMPALFTNIMLTLLIVQI